MNADVLWEVTLCKSFGTTDGLYESDLYRVYSLRQILLKKGMNVDYNI